MKFANIDGDFEFDTLWQKCVDAFNDLADRLKDTHELVPSCNADKTMYLVPKGTACQITYSSKPVGSYRLSDHWNWKANLKKNPISHYIQCFTRDLPWCRKRSWEGGASEPVMAYMIGYFDKDLAYHCVYGEKFNRHTRKWEWEESINV